MLKLLLAVEGISVLTPRQTLQESLQAGLIDDGNAWSEIQRYRNLTSHTYNERLADEVYAFIGASALQRFVFKVDLLHWDRLSNTRLKEKIPIEGRSFFRQEPSE